MKQTKDGRVILLSIVSALVPPACYQAAAHHLRDHGYDANLHDLHEATGDARGREALIESMLDLGGDIQRHFDAVAAEKSAAAERLTMSNTRLVMNIARNYAGRGMENHDLFMEGVTGLLTAVERYNYRMGWKFSTYATWWIRQAVSKGLAESEPIRLPNGVRSNVAKAYNARNELERSHRQADAADVAERLGWSVEKVKNVEAAPRRPVSLDMPMSAHNNDQSEFRLVDRMPSDAPESADLTVSNVQTNEVHAIMSRNLTPLQIDVVSMRYGLLGHEPMSRAAVAIALKPPICESEVASIERESLETMKKKLILQGITEAALA